MKKYFTTRKDQLRRAATRVYLTAESFCIAGIYKIAWRLTGLWLRVLFNIKFPIAGRLSFSTRLRALAASPGVSLAFLSIFITLIISAIQQDLFQASLAILLSLGTSAFVLLALVASQVSFYAARPRTLAELIISGRRGNQALAALAVENLLLLKRSTAFVKALDVFAKRVRLVVTPNISQVEKDIFRRTCEARELLADERIQIKRCKACASAMKDGQFRYIRLSEELVFSASTELNIKPEKLSGSLLHFSPTIFRERTEEIDEKFTEMIDSLALFASTWGSAGEGDAEVIDGLAEAVEEIVSEGEKRAKHQERILENHRLNARLLEVVASRSSTLASQRYTRCLAQALKIDEVGDRWWWRRKSYSRIRASLKHQDRIVRMLLEDAAGYKLLDKEIKFERQAERLRYLHAMQQAYPGIWPHMTVAALFKNIMQSRRATAAGHSDVPAKCHFLTVKRQYQILLFGPKLRGTTLATIAKKWYSEVELACDDHKDSGYHRDSWARVNLVEVMSRYVTIHIKNAKRQIALQFEHFLRQWLYGETGTCFLVTQGNSSTVRAALKQAFSVMQGRLKDKVYTVCFPSEGDSHFLEPRRIIHSLKFPEMRSSPHRSQSAILRLETFSKMLNKGDSVLFVVGTEGVDADWRFVHPMGLSTLRQGLQKECAERGVRLYSVVLAEDHKLHHFSWKNLSASGAQVDAKVEVLTPDDSRPGRLITDRGCYLRRSYVSHEDVNSRLSERHPNTANTGAR